MDEKKRALFDEDVAYDFNKIMSFVVEKCEPEELANFTAALYKIRQALSQTAVDVEERYEQVFDYLFAALGYHGIVQEFDKDKLAAVAMMAKKPSEGHLQDNSAVVRDLAEALEKISKHQQIVGGGMASKCSTKFIADAALQKHAHRISQARQSVDAGKREGCDG